jgi:TonB family protein
MGPTRNIFGAFAAVQGFSARITRAVPDASHRMGSMALSGHTSHVWGAAMRTIIFLFALMAASAAQTAAPVPSLYPQGSDAANSVGQMVSAVMLCAMVPHPGPDVAKSVTGPTVVTAQFSHGVATATYVTSQSGNPDLDKRVVDCLKNAPADLAAALVDGQKIVVPVYWPSSRPANAITVQRAVPPPPGSTSGITAPLGLTRHQCEQMYPPIAVRLGEQGTARILITVSATGAVTDVGVAASSGYDDLDRASVACAMQWTYRPATQNGVPIAVRTQALIKWALVGPYPSISGPVGWIAARPGEPRALATYIWPEAAGSRHQTVTFGIYPRRGTLADLIPSLPKIVSGSGFQWISGKQTTICSGEDVYEIEYSRTGGVTDHPGLTEIVEEVDTVSDGFAYRTTYDRFSDDTVRPEAEAWIHAHCRRSH